MRNKKFDWVGGIVGNPEALENEWNDEQMAALQGLGINLLQLNLGWGGRPGGEVLNMEDIDDEKRAQFRFRIAQAQKHGMRVMPHFGVPQLLNVKEGYSVITPACIQDPQVVANYTERLVAFLREFPEIADVMIYTFDQDSWLCSEFGDCPRCAGVPLHERLPRFLNAMQDALQHGREGARLWWQPWEISAGQTYRIMQAVRPERFGIIVNNSIAETYPSNTSDLWVRNTIRIAAERGIPVIGEMQFSGCQIGCHSVQKLPCPELVYEQAEAFRAIDGVVGIREHFGIAVSKMSVNTDLFREYVKNPEAPLSELLAAVAAGYGPNATDELLAAWNLSARAVRHIPFDASYSFCNLTHKPAKHDWDAATVPAWHWDTPAWEANRRSFYMITHTTAIHPWMLEDLGLRMGEAANYFREAVKLLEEALAKGVEKADDVRDQIADLNRLASSLRGSSLHYLETIAAYDLRVALKQGNKEKYAAACERLGHLLDEDLVNQDGDEEMREVRDRFVADPETWVRLNLQQPYRYDNPVRLETFDQRW
ncbi:hypothetical protein ACFSR7_13255 [Cohnella sp. GCM10020058]|uniref:hypothetical protein n=1 Tax=Cohnella sp. GCM10020058 TaxID=3317330 RepID=UPI003639A5D8